MLGEIAFTDGSANRLGGVVENAIDEREITDGGCHQDIGLGAAVDEEARNVVPIRLSPFQVLPRTSHVLCGGRFMVDVASVNVGPVVEQQSSDLNRGSEMEWQLAVTAACMHELRILGQEFADTVDFPKPRGGMDIDDCAARDEIVRKPRTGAIEDAEAAGPPASTLVDIGAGIEQHVDDLAVLFLNSSNEGRRIEAVVRQRLIDAEFERGMMSQNISDE